MLLDLASPAVDRLRRRVDMISRRRVLAPSRQLIGLGCQDRVEREILSRMAAATSAQILLGYDVAEPAVVGNELLD